jgi:hypothetical protein
MRDLHLIVAIDDQTCDAGATGCEKWIKGQSYDVVSTASFAKLPPPGKHTLRLGLLDGDRAIALPLPDGDGRTYPIGRITISP